MYHSIKFLWLCNSATSSFVGTWPVSVGETLVFVSLPGSLIKCGYNRLALISLVNDAVAPRSLSSMCLVLLKVSFRNFASVSAYRMLRYRCNSFKAIKLNGRMDEADDTRTENAKERTV